MSTRRRVVNTILLLAIPVMVENLLQTALGFADKFFVSKLGTEGLVGVGVTNLVMNVVLSFFLAIAMGTAATVARRVGAGEQRRAQRAIVQSVYLSIAFGITLGIGMLVFHRGILRALGLEPAVIEFVRPYFLAVTVPSVFLSLSTTLSASLRASGNTKSPMQYSLVANGLNTTLTPLLIFGIGSFGGIGILGAGLATSFSRLVAVVLLARRLKSPASIVSLPSLRQNGRIRVPPIHLSTLLPILRIGSPVAIERLSMRVGQLLYQSLIILVGTQSFAAYTIAGELGTFAWIGGLGFGVTAATLVGQSLGRKDRDGAFEVGLWCYALGGAFMVFIGVVNAIFAPTLVGLFTDVPAVKNTGVFILRILCLVEPFTAVTIIVTNALQGAGDTRFPMITTILGIWIFRVGGSFLLVKGFGMGLTGIVAMFAIDVITRSFLIFHRYFRKRWMEIVV